MKKHQKKHTKKLQWNKILSYAGITALFICGILIRTPLLHEGIDYESYDLVTWIIPWYDYIKSRGILEALGENFSNYTPPYTYLLSIMTLVPVSKVLAIKLISIIMDFVNAFIVYKIVEFQRQSKLISLCAAGIFLCLPTLYINSTIWGQSDAIYTGFLLMSVYFLIKERPFWGVLAFSISFAFKAQAVFFAPFLAILLLKRRVKLWHFLLVPGVYIILCLPVVLLGRSWGDVLTIYLQQGNTLNWLSLNAPNLYAFIPNTGDAFTPNDDNQLAVWIGLAFASICLGLWIFFTAKDGRFFDNKKLIQLAFISLALSPFLLPKMHDRYFYPADVFSLVLAFCSAEFWFLPIAYQIVSGLAYTPFLLGFPGAIPLGIATSVNAISLIVLLKNQFYNVNRSD
jgi:Gpi18-like mannosyltransferase